MKAHRIESWKLVTRKTISYFCKLINVDVHDFKQVWEHRTDIWATLLRSGLIPNGFTEKMFYDSILKGKEKAEAKKAAEK